MYKRKSLKIRHKRKPRIPLLLSPQSSKKYVTDSGSADAAVQLFDNQTDTEQSKNFPKPNNKITVSAMPANRPLGKSKLNYDRCTDVSNVNTLSVPEPDFKPLRKSSQTCDRSTIFPKTDGIKFLSLGTTTEFKSLRKSQQTYAQAIRESMPNSGGYILGTGPISLSESPSSSVNSGRSNKLSTNTPHVTDQDSQECERYQQLLTLIVPSLYNVNNSLEKTSNKNSLCFEQECSAILSTRSSTRANTSGNNSISMPTPIDTISLDDYACDEDDFVYMCSKAETDSIKSLRIQQRQFEESPKTTKSSSEDRTLQQVFRSSYHLKIDWLEMHRLKCAEKKSNRTLKELNKTLDKKKELKDNGGTETDIIKLLKNIQLINRDEPKLNALTAAQNARITAGINGSLDQVLISQFNINITRRDLRTLVGHNWLNDEVINFYMNLLITRSEKKHISDGLPLVYAFNTFFIPRLMQSGYSGVKRWTRKVDIFAKEIIPVPVHVGGVHWCMAIIHLKNHTIKYYDSMGRPNSSVLQALEQYLKDESMDKKRQHLDSSQFKIESVINVPRQMNGSDCGVFSCMFAEYITRNADVTFSQEDMEYFRKKMILEILEGELMD